MPVKFYFNHSLLRTLLLLFAGLLSARIATGQAQPDHTVSIAGKRVILPANGRDWRSLMRGKPAPQLVLMEFEQPLDKGAIGLIGRNDGIRIISSLGGSLYIALLERSPETITPVLLRSVVMLDPAWKIDPAFRTGTLSGNIAASVAFVPGTSPATINDRLKEAGATLLTSPFTAHGLYECILPAAGISALAAFPEVLCIARKGQDVPLNAIAQKATKANIAHAAVSNGGWALLGDSMTVGIGDNASALYHIDTRDRVVNYNPAISANHGQHTNGTVGGAGIIDNYAEGFAPHTKLVDQFYNLIWANTAAYRSAYGMHVTSNSYTNGGGLCSTAGTYDVYSQVLDTVALQYPDVLHVFAAGNDGNLGCAPYPAFYGTVTGGYQTSKNVLVVANIDKTYAVNAAPPPNGASSRGPIKDGRLKPEISAIGTNLYSTRSADQYQVASGTSMACPQVAGGAALLQQRYKQINGGALPSSALVKILLMNGAMDLGNPGPDFSYGFGMMDLRRSLMMLDAGHYTTGSIATGSTQTPVTITVPANTAELKVMLYWHDAPASPLSTSQLINDLDLSVTDPSANTRQPLILNPAAASVADTAIPGADHRNNVEQVVFYNPTAGSYTVNVAGYSVPYGPQPYVVAYDVVPAGLTLTSPNVGDAFENGALMYIYWTASRGTGTFTLELSTDNGSSWTTINNSIGAGARVFTYTPSGINGAQCRMRLSRPATGETFTSGAFTISNRPSVQLQPVQCPGYVATIWQAVPNVTGYAVYQKLGYYMQQIATTTDTFYTRGGLPYDSISYFAVAPLFGTAKGFRSLAVSRMPATGTCSGNISNGDLAVDSITTPVTGRVATSTALTSNEMLRVLVHNLDDAAVSTYSVAYQINGGSWSSQTLGSIAAGSTSTATFTGLNLATAGTYTIRVAITNLAATDPVSANDTLTNVVRQLQNAAVNLLTGFTEDFESSAKITCITDTAGFTLNERWDYFNSTDSGRMRTFVDSSIAISGMRSISMDAFLQPHLQVFNLLTGTFNLGAYDTLTDEVRLEFGYKLHGTPKSPDSNRVWVRGTDTKPWLPVYDYTLPANPGAVINSGTLSLTDVLRKGGQDFSSATQIGFGQRDTSVIAENDYGNGLTLDNVRLYAVSNDVGIARILSPDTVNCAMVAASPLSLLVYNGVNNAVPKVYLYYQLDGGPVNIDSIATIAGKDTVTFTFAQLMNTAALGPHTLNVWLHAANDTYTPNDSVLGFVFRNEPLITGYPYLENFEGGNDYWFSGGRNNSWAFGTPAGATIHKAASGTKAWKTSLAGYYNDNERSYLYSPCFDISNLSSPMLSFSVALQIENCGSGLCDGAWVEYSINGGTWTKLGAAGQGTNWYNSSAFQLWNTQTGTRWQVASIPLPVASQPLRIRFVLSSDPGTGFEGIAVDDIHIYNHSFPLYTGGNAGPLTQTVSASNFTSFTPGNALLAQINPGTGNLGSTVVRSYQHSNIIDTVAMQYYLPRNFVVNTQNAATDSPTVRLYVSDADVVTLVNATGCPSCSKPEDAYELGVSKYDDTSDTSRENDLLTDDVHGPFRYIPYTRVKWVPYDAGYYAEFKVDGFSELWLNDGGPAHAFPLPIASVLFDVQRKTSPEEAVLSWQTFVDTQVSSYKIERSDNAIDFVNIATVISVGDNSHRYTYTDPKPTPAPPVTYYRLKYILRDGKAYYSNVRQVIWSGRGAVVNVYPNPAPDGNVQIDWTAALGSTLEVSVTDVVGRTVLRTGIKSAGYSNRSTLNLGGAGKGIYFVHISVGGERFDVKVVCL